LNCDLLTISLERSTAEKLYSFLYRSENKLDRELVLLLDRMEKEHFGQYSIEKMKELTVEEIS
jgi:hypothetical protein